jgi:hypothetical protein
VLALRDVRLFDSNMSSFSVLSRLASGSGLRRVNAHVRAGANRRCMRYIATQEENKRNVNEKLPLAGIRVLDMTRVLAGVSNGCNPSSETEADCCSLTVRKYLETLGISFTHNLIASTNIFGVRKL